MDRVEELLQEWRHARAELAALERTEHSDITDPLGRVWTWWKGDLYRHCGMAVPGDFLSNDRMRPPTEAVLDNPNYPKLCAICLDGRTQTA